MAITGMQQTNKPKSVFKNTCKLAAPLLVILIGITSCNGQSKPGNEQATAKSNVPVPSATPLMDYASVAPRALSKNISGMLQDRHGLYWFATKEEGLYCYDGTSLRLFTEKDGLNSNAVWSIQEDKTGNLWLNTGNGICTFNGKAFIDFTDTLKRASQQSLPYKKGNLIFGHEGEVYQYDGSMMSKLVIYPPAYHPETSDMDRPYGIYCFLEDRAGNLWLGTDQKGVCFYDPSAVHHEGPQPFKYFTGIGLSGGAVRALFQDRNGHLWFGNNGYGLFHYDGKTIINFTEEKRLGNAAFLQKKGLGKAGTLARVWTINEDNDGNLWIGTIDAGVWRYDGKNLINYTTKDGLTSNAVYSIYKDKKGDLWFITDGAGVCKFNGKTFSPFVVS